jgi:hypothetical protein
MLSLAEWDAERLGANWNVAIARAIGRGVLVNSRVVGYRRRRSGRLKVDPVIAAVIAEVFACRAAGVPLMERRALWRLRACAPPAATRRGVLTPFGVCCDGGSTLARFDSLATSSTSSEWAPLARRPQSPAKPASEPAVPSPRDNGRPRPPLRHSQRRVPETASIGPHPGQSRPSRGGGSLVNLLQTGDYSIRSCWIAPRRSGVRVPLAPCSPLLAGRLSLTLRLRPCRRVCPSPRSEELDLQGFSRWSDRFVGFQAVIGSRRA